MDMLDLYIRVVKALDDIGASYMIVGAFGGTIYGITRAAANRNLRADSGHNLPAARGDMSGLSTTQA